MALIVVVLRIDAAGIEVQVVGVGSSRVGRRRPIVAVRALIVHSARAVIVVAGQIGPGITTKGNTTNRSIGSVC